MARRRRKRHHNRRRRRHRNAGLVAPFAGNPRRRRRRNQNPRHHRRRRRNPGMSLTPRGLFGQITQGAVDGLETVAGKAGARAIPALVGLHQTGVAGVAIQATAAVLLGFFGGKVNRNLGKMLLAGGLGGIIEGYVKDANIPVLSPALGDEYHPELGAYTSAGDLTAGSTALDTMGLYHGMSGDDDTGQDTADSVGFLPS